MVKANKDTRKRYVVTICGGRLCGRKFYNVIADSHITAAVLVVMYMRAEIGGDIDHPVRATRCVGEPPGSGVFQPYIRLNDGTLSSAGPYMFVELQKAI